MLRIGDAVDYPQLDIILPFVDDFIKTATGHDWAVDESIDPTAKMVAIILTVRWFVNPGQMGETLKSSDPLVAMIGQLQAKALAMVII